MSSSDWIIIPTIGENKSHVSNHQPDIICLNMFLYLVNVVYHPTTPIAGLELVKSSLPNVAGRCERLGDFGAENLGENHEKTT